jgi:serine protease Do
MSATGKASIAVVVIVAFVAGVLFTTAGANWFDLGDRVASESRAGDTRIDAPTTDVASLEDAFTQVSEAVNPTVVQIRSERVRQRRAPNMFEGTPFEDFFNRPDGEQREYRAQGLGSGVVVRSDGYVVTNNHVVEDADELQVVLSDGTSYDGEIVGTDPASDLAVLKIDADNLPVISFGQMDDVRVGQWVLAFGSPFSMDLSNTVTAGIVSAFGRTSANLSSLNPFAAFIQTDAAINPGNSGGPLVNLRGELIGINTAIYTRSQGYQGIGFAIPVSVVDNISSQLVETGTVKRGYLGVTFARVPSSLAEARDVPSGSAQVTGVEPGTPAENAGLQEGDIITSVDGQQLRDFNQLRTIIGNKQPGDDVALTIVRDDAERTIDVTLGTRPSDEELTENQQRPSSPDAESMEALGLDLQNLTPQLRERLGFEGAETLKGVIITSVDPGSDAYREADLREGNIITEVDRRPVSSVEDFMAIYDDLPAGETFLVRVLRVGNGQAQPFFTALTKPE